MEEVKKFAAVIADESLCGVWRKWISGAPIHQKDSNFGKELRSDGRGIVYSLLLARSSSLSESTDC
jgi:hypothetical protein